MEFCPRTLAGVLQDGPLQEEDAWQVLRGILAGEDLEGPTWRYGTNLHGAPYMLQPRKLMTRY